MERRRGRGAWRHVPHAARRNQRTGRGRCGDASGADELREAVEPGLLSLRRRTVLQQLLRHEKRSCRAGRRAAQRGGNTVPRRVQGGGLLFAEVVLSVVDVVVVGVLDAGLGVDTALRSRAPTRAATRAACGSGGGASRPASETFGTRTGHGCVEDEDAPQPPTWRAKCRRFFPGTGGVSKVSCKGLNTESNNPQRAPATVLVGLTADDTEIGRAHV